MYNYLASSLIHGTSCLLLILLLAMVCLWLEHDVIFSHPSLFLLHRVHPQLLRQGRAVCGVRWQGHRLSLPLHHVWRLQGNCPGPSVAQSSSRPLPPECSLKFQFKLDPISSIPGLRSSRCLVVLYFLACSRTKFFLSKSKIIQCMLGRVCCLFFFFLEKEIMK